MKRFVFVAIIIAQVGVAQIPSLSDGIVIEHLREIATTNQLGLMEERQMIVQGIQMAQQGIQIINELRAIEEYGRQLMRDIESIKNLDISSLNALNNFIMNGDRIDFYFKGTTRKLLRDVYKLGKLESIGSQLYQKYQGQALGPNEIMTEQISASLIDSLNRDMQRMDISALEAIEEEIKAMQKQVNEMIETASDPNVEMDTGTRTMLVYEATNLSRKTGDKMRKLEVEASERGMKLMAEEARRQSIKRSIERRMKYAKKIKNSEDAKYGFFDSKYLPIISF